VCGGGYVIDPAPPRPTCDRDGAALKRSSEEAYTQASREDDFEASPPKARSKKAKR